MSNHQPNSNSWKDQYHTSLKRAVPAYVDSWMNIFIAVWMLPEDWTTIQELDVCSVYRMITPTMQDNLRVPTSVSVADVDEFIWDCLDRIYYVPSTSCPKPTDQAETKFNGLHGRISCYDCAEIPTQL